MKILGRLLASLILIAPFLAACDTQSNAPMPLSVQANTLNEDWAVEWWLPRHEQKLLDKEKQNIELIFIGDSITHGWETEGKAIWDNHFAPRNGFNLGFGGDRTENVLWRLDNGAVDDLKPKLVILMIGTNNTGHRMDSPEETVSGIDAIIDKLSEKLPHTNILLLGIFPRGAQPDDPMRLRNREINQRLAAAAAKTNWKHKNATVHFRDISSVFLNESGEISTSIMPDLLHLSPEGYRLWAEAIDADVTRLMGG